MNRTAIVITIVITIAVASTAVLILNNERNKADDTETEPEVTSMQLILTVDGNKIPVKWNDNASVNAVKKLAKDTLTIEMSRYGGFEQTGHIGKSIVRDDKSIDVGCGDIVLYNSEQICLYFSDNSYSFTRLGKIDMSDEDIISMLDVPNVKAVFTLE